MIKNFICFPKDFLNKISIDTENAVLKGRPNFFRGITANDPKIFQKKCKNFSEIISSKFSYGEVESSLKAPLIFFDSQPHFFRSIFKNITICQFYKTFSPESFLWKWESSSDEDAEIFLTKSREFVTQGPKKIRRTTIQKKFVPKVFLWTPNFLLLITLPKFFRQGFEKIPFIVQKKRKSVCFD